LYRLCPARIRGENLPESNEDIDYSSACNCLRLREDRSILGIPAKVIGVSLNMITQLPDTLTTYVAVTVEWIECSRHETGRVLGLVVRWRNNRTTRPAHDIARAKDLGLIERRGRLECHTRILDVIAASRQRAAKLYRFWMHPRAVWPDRQV